jgi:hypothetical protein
LEQPFSGRGCGAAAIFLFVPPNPYVLLTIQLFRTQLFAARAAGDGEMAAAFEAAIRSLLEDQPSCPRGDVTSWSAPAPN